MAEQHMADRGISRRQYLTTGITLGAATAGALAWPFGDGGRAQASVTMGQLSISDDEATVSNPPAEITLSVSGEWTVTAPSTPEQVRQVLQIEYDGTAEDIAENVNFDGGDSGTYSLSANVFDHPELSGDVVIPAESGQVKTTEITVRVIVMVVSDGEIQQEASVEDTASVRITRNGIEIAVGGSGSVEVVTAN